MQYLFFCCLYNYQEIANIIAINSNKVLYSVFYVVLCVDVSCKGTYSYCNNVEKRLSLDSLLLLALFWIYAAFQSLQLKLLLYFPELVKVIVVALT